MHSPPSQRTPHGDRQRYNLIRRDIFVQSINCIFTSSGISSSPPPPILLSCATHSALSRGTSTILSVYSNAIRVGCRRQPTLDDHARLTLFVIVVVVALQQRHSKKESNVPKRNALQRVLHIFLLQSSTKQATNMHRCYAGNEAM